jgi:hypothetical protein
MTTWPSGNRDTTEFPVVEISTDPKLRAHLEGFIRLDGIPWNDYEKQRDASKLDIEDTRLRTYRKMYEQLGLIYQAGDKIKLTSLGVKIQSLERELEFKKEALLASAAQDAIDILSRYQFKNPIDDRNHSLPDDFDVFPYWTIWKVMSELDGKLHHEELNRVVLRIDSMTKVSAAIDKIRAARNTGINYSNAAENQLTNLLGERVVSDQPTARMASWFSIAGWGGLIISLSSEDGFRHFNLHSQVHISKAISIPPVLFQTDSRDEWIKHYIGKNINQNYSVSSQETSPDKNKANASHEGVGKIGSADLKKMVEQFFIDSQNANFHIKRTDAHRFIASLLSKRFLIATGLAGSGKTKLAQAFASWLTPNAISADPFTPGAKINSDRTTYFVKVSNSEFIEFWNSDDEQNATKVGLPRRLIEEWATYIDANKVPASTPAREIREAVKVSSKYSDQLHSFETHLKAAALALIEARGSMKDTRRYEVVSVGADWTGNENILGYPNGLDPSSYISKPTLDLILQAELNPTEPYFLILDEMNLSHVERYFADVLSAIESGERINLHRDETRRADGKMVPKSVGLPKNLFIIGTVNIDETTYMFSPKVLDRANVIEFRITEEDLASFLCAPISPNLPLMTGKGTTFGKEFVKAADGTLPTFVDPLKSNFEHEMLLFFHVLESSGAEFGYRVAHEAARFVEAYKLLGNHEDADTVWFESAFDLIVAQKFLPKLHGSRAKLGPLLKKLWFLSVNAEAKSAEGLREALDAAGRSTEKQHEPSQIIPASAPFKVSAEKISRMWRLLNDNGFASFAEA